MMVGMRTMLAALALPLALAACAGDTAPSEKKAEARPENVTLLTLVTDTTRAGIFEWDGGDTCTEATGVEVIVHDADGTIVGSAQTTADSEITWRGGDTGVGCSWATSMDLPPSDFYDLEFRGGDIGTKSFTWQRDGKTSGQVTYTAG